MSSIKNVHPYGLWPSPLKASIYSRRFRFDDVQFSADGDTLVWLEDRSGQGFLVKQTHGDARRDLFGEFSARGGLNYGGGEFCAGSDAVYFVHARQQIFKRPLKTGAPRPITPVFGSIGSPAISPDGRWIVFGFSDGREDVLALVDSEGRDWPVKLVRGSDFYMQPVWNPTGERLAWVEWDHPNMPWDDTRLCLADFDPQSGRIKQHQVIAGSPGENPTQPVFSPDGQTLCYLTNQGDWDQIVLLDLKTGQKRVLLEEAGLVLRTPAWIQGIRSVGWNPSGQALYSIRYNQGKASLWSVSIKNGSCEKIDTGPYTFLKQLSVSPVRDELAFIGSSPQIPERVLRWDGRLQVAAYSDLQYYPPAIYSIPQPVQWKSLDGLEVHGLYHPPVSESCDGEGAPPVIIHVHSGPTSQSYMEFHREASFFTSRGFAWLDVNYRGSSGYGRKYQNALRGEWGRGEVLDVVSGVQELAGRGLIDPHRATIYGSSAGGYTVLNALIQFPGVFKAGICLYGVTNLFTVSLDTHKFEQHYNDSLIGTLPKDADKFREFSPLFHAHKIKDSLALFHGREDPVVPLSQSEELAAELRKNKVPHLFHIFENEGHGFRKPETMTELFERIEKFLIEFVLFSA